MLPSRMENTSWPSGHTFPHLQTLEGSTAGVYCLQRGRRRRLQWKFGFVTCDVVAVDRLGIQALVWRKK